MKNLFINEYRKYNCSQIHKKPENYDMNKLANLDSRSTYNNAVDLLEHESTRNIVNNIIDNTFSNSEVYKEVVDLTSMDYQYDEISVILSIPIGTVRSILHRIRNVMNDKREYILDAV